MVQALLILWIMLALFITVERNFVKTLIWFGIFSLVTSLCFLLLGAPDVAMAEAAVSVFTTIFFAVCLAKYYSIRDNSPPDPPQKLRIAALLKTYTVPLLFTGFVFVLFLHFIPDYAVSTYLKTQYIAMFARDIGGENAVTAIYLGYRLYDTLFEALILVISVIAVAHMSWFGEISVKDGKHSEIEDSSPAIFTMRVICPLILLFGAYLILNGQYTPGGGFQGGVAIATFFVCRYLIYNIYDIRIDRILKIEEMIFVATTLLAVLIVFLGAAAYIPGVYLPLFQNIYLIVMNTLIGIKVACAFFILFYRFIAIERR